MLSTILTVTLITLAIVAPVIALALCKSSGKADKSLEHPERVTLKGDK